MCPSVSLFCANTCDNYTKSLRTNFSNYLPIFGMDKVRLGHRADFNSRGYEIHFDSYEHQFFVMLKTPRYGSTDPHRRYACR